MVAPVKAYNYFLSLIVPVPKGHFESIQLMTLELCMGMTGLGGQIFVLAKSCSSARESGRAISVNPMMHQYTQIFSISHFR